MSKERMKEDRDADEVRVFHVAQGGGSGNEGVWR